jgi:rare lipoprotein A
MTMAHKTLPFGTKVRVTNMKNKRSVVVRVNDRGPTTPDRVGDLSTAAARKIGMLKSGVVEAKLEVVAQAKGRTGERASKRT